MQRMMWVLGLVVVLASSAVMAEQAPSSSPAVEVASQSVVDVNSATAEQLQTLPGVGPRTAERIIEYRRDNGSFKKIEELMSVRGIGERSFLRLRALVKVGDVDAGSSAGR